VPGDRLDQTLVADTTESAGDPTVFYIGAYAADRGRWADHESAVGRMRGLAQSQLAAGDSTKARFTEAASQALEAYALWKHGQTAEAAAQLERALPSATGHGPEFGVNAAIRWTLATLYLEAGRPRDAERYLASFLNDPLASYQLGKVYEELGDYAKARDSYAFCLTSWRDADPELQPKVQEVRAAVQRLTSAIKE
jgi:tetratricopeptide (TPR) repeat protein